MIKSFQWIPAPTSCLQLSVSTVLAGIAVKAGRGSGCAVPSASHHCPLLFASFHPFPHGKELLARTHSYAFFSSPLSFHSLLFPSVFPLCVCAQDVFVMSLAQCPPLVVVIFTTRVHFGAALLSSLVFLVASVMCNTVWVILKSIPWQLKTSNCISDRVYFRHVATTEERGGEMDWIEHRRRGEQWKVKCLGSSSIFNKRETDKTEEGSE